jgi:ADP-ribosylglycohydrolase
MANLSRDALEQKFLGCILGLAIGDALGAPVEFMKIDQIHDTFGQEGVTGFVDGRHPAGTFTDDTQMSLAIARALITVGEKEPIQGAGVDAIMEEISGEFVRWAFGPENNRSPGHTCMRGCTSLRDGMSWRESGVAGSKGCGTAMRSAPIGLVFCNNHEKLKEVAVAASVATHGHHCALAGGAATAYLVALAVENTAPDRYLEMLCDFTADISEEFVGKIRQVQDCLKMEPEEAFGVLGDA